jgi:hypothetical protein
MPYKEDRDTPVTTKEQRIVPVESAFIYAVAYNDKNLKPSPLVDVWVGDNRGANVYKDVPRNFYMAIAPFIAAHRDVKIVSAKPVLIDLDIIMVTGLYRYYDVPLSVVEDLEHAIDDGQSIGRFYNERIKDKYISRKIMARNA